ncbi:TetR/AcrR family transcriptional regulator [Vibrio marisflavi]|uniref:Transcriptional regulator AcuR n=1 Tax=Vibrio marisflavi CECT 7928 TaxID=634439 RepID=A0ABN8E809_9VIBR|nr:TetR/AcrR family transcriptional regulator [Vibrio marisflavi]CAH0540342.1 Transcriptional regulator AcuR [Vibrio marisflavi CECT 7928]
MRNAEFDREQVLRSAMEAFIAKGYSKTSMQDLKKATGLHPGSIYCAFDNKRGLLLAALEQYRNERRDEFNSLFDDAGSVLKGVEAYLEHVVEECESENIKDCLLQKALSELSQQDEEIEKVIGNMLKDWQRAFEDKFHRAQQVGEISGSKVPAELAQFFVMNIYGLRTFSHTNPEPGTLRNLSKIIMDYIKN